MIGEEGFLSFYCLSKRHPVCDLLLTSAPDNHVALLQVDDLVMNNVHDSLFCALVHQIRFGQDAWEDKTRRHAASSTVQRVVECCLSLPFTQSPLSFRIHLLRHLQRLSGCDVHGARNNHQADGFLFCDEFMDQSLDLKESKCFSVQFRDLLVTW